MIRPGDLTGHSDFHLFKEGIKPMWEVRIVRSRVCMLLFLMTDNRIWIVLHYRMMLIRVEVNGLSGFVKAWRHDAGRI